MRCRFTGVFRQPVIPNYYVAGCIVYTYIQRDLSCAAIMLERIFYKQLYRTRHHKVFHKFLFNFDHNIERCTEPYLHQFRIFMYEIQFFFYCDQILLFILYHIPIQVRQLIDERRSFLVKILSYKTVQNIKVVEHEMRLDLLLQSDITVIRDI